MARIGEVPVSRAPAAPELSIVIPFFNEAGNIASLIAELREALSAIPVGSEVLAVDDGSIDNTRSELEAAALAWPALRIIGFEKNQGQAAACFCAFEQALGLWVGMLDGDGQNPPAELVRLWSIRDSADMIVGVRAQRKDSWLRRAMSRVANAARRFVLRDGVSDTGCSLKLFRRSMVPSFLPIRTMYSFLPAFAISGGWSVREIAVAHRARQAGASKYGLRVMAIGPCLDLLALAWILRRTIKRNRQPGTDPRTAR